MRTKMVIDRFSQLVERQFGCQVGYTDLLNKDIPKDLDVVETVRRNKRSKLIVTSSDLLIPIEKDDYLYGFLSIFKGVSLSPEDVEKVQDLAELLVKSVVISEQQKKLMDRLDEYLTQKVKNEDAKGITYGRLKTKSKVFGEQIHMATRQGAQKYPILILAKTGAASEDLAREIHSHSPCLEFLPFEDIDPKNFKDLDGLLSLGNNTIFIKEIAAVDQEIQFSLEAYLKLDAKPKRSPRIIAATTENPKDLVENKKVTQGLMFCLSAARVTMPPLEERKDDVLELIHFFSKAHSEGRKSLSSYSLETLRKLTEYRWSGNEEELENEIKRLVQTIDKSQIPPYALDKKIVGEVNASLFEILAKERKLNAAVNRLEEYMIAKSLKANDGNKSQVSRELGLSRSALHQKVADLGLMN